MHSRRTGSAATPPQRSEAFSTLQRGAWRGVKQRRSSAAAMRIQAICLANGTPGLRAWSKREDTIANLPFVQHRRRHCHHWHRLRCHRCLRRHLRWCLRHPRHHTRPRFHRACERTLSRGLRPQKIVRARPSPCGPKSPLAGAIPTPMQLRWPAYLPVQPSDRLK